MPDDKQVSPSPAEPPKQVPPPNPPSVAIPAQQAKPSKAAQYVEVTAVQNAMNGHNFRGVCNFPRCGWQTHQPVKVLAQDATIAHVRGRHGIE